MFGNFYLFNGPCACWEPDWWSEDRDDVLGDDEPKVLRLFLWTSGDSLWDWEGASLSVTFLPVSETLMRDIRRWETDYDLIGEHLVRSSVDAIWEMSPAVPTDWFNRRGEALKERLVAELGSEWTIEYQPLQREYRRERIYRR